MIKRILPVHSKTAQKLFSTNNGQHCNVTKAADVVDTSFPQGWSDGKPYPSIPGPKELPVLGNKWRFLPLIGEFYNKNSLELQKSLYEKYGKIVRLGGLPLPDSIMLYDPDDIAYLFRNEGIYPIRDSVAKSFGYYRKNVRLDVFEGACGVAEVHGKEWHAIRSKVNPIVMHPQTVLQYAGDMDSIAKLLVNKMRTAANSHPIREMSDDFMMSIYAWTLESIMFVCLDKKLGCLSVDLSQDSEQSKIIKSVLEMFQLFHKIERDPTMDNIYKSKTWKRYVEVMDYITFTFLRHLSDAIKDIDKNENKPPEEMSILQQLLRIDKKQAIVTAIDFLIGGVDTTGKVAASSLYFLAKSPEAQKKLRDELVSLLPTKECPITKDVLSKASYLKAVIKETTRLAPIGSGNMRRTVKNMLIQGYQIPKGTNVVSCNLLLSHMDKYYTRPMEFIPERHLRSTTGELSARTTNPFVTLPFGFGPRSCLGKRLANLELEIGIGQIIRNFYLEWHYKDATFSSSPFYGITDPLKLRVYEVEE